MSEPTRWQRFLVDLREFAWFLPLAIAAGVLLGLILRFAPELGVIDTVPGWASHGLRVGLILFFVLWWGVRDEKRQAMYLKAAERQARP